MRHLTLRVLLLVPIVKDLMVRRQTTEPELIWSRKGRERMRDGGRERE